MHSWKSPNYLKIATYTGQILKRLKKAQTCGTILALAISEEENLNILASKSLITVVGYFCLCFIWKKIDRKFFTGHKFEEKIKKCDFQSKLWQNPKEGRIFKVFLKFLWDLKGNV